MEMVNIHEAKTHLSRLVDEALKGEPFVIARADRPLVKVTMVDSPSRAGRAFFNVPDDFDAMGADEIAAMFEGRADP